MSDYRSRLASRPVWLTDEPAPGIAPALTRAAPQERSEPRRTEILPTAAAVARKREGKRERMLERLKCGSATTWELMSIGGSGFSSRIAELREAGHRIDCEEHEDGAVYTLEPEDRSLTWGRY